MLDAAKQISSRENIHDLRNLFGIVASGSHLLEGRLTAEKRSLILDAISDAARRGGHLTTALLAKDANPMLKSLDLNEHLGQLEGLLAAQAAPGLEICLDISSTRSPVKLDAASLDAAILELVANARTAVRAGGTIHVRSKRIGRRVWILVADTGVGASRASLDAILAGETKAGANGSGLRRVRRFAEAAHGRLLIRSRQGCGTVAALALPVTLFLGARSEAANVGFPPVSDRTRSRARGRRGAQQPVLSVWQGTVRHPQPEKQEHAMATQPGAPEPDIVRPQSPPERPAPADPGERPQPGGPEILPDQPDFDRPDSYPPEIPGTL